MDNSHSGKRILVIAPTPFFADRGCHVRILEESRALIKLGHSVVVCSYHIGRDIDGIEMRRTIKVPWYSKLSAGPSLHKFYMDLLLLATVIRCCIQCRPDVIHAHLHEGIIIGKIARILFRVPLVGDLQGSLTAELIQHDFIKENGLIYRIFRRLEIAIVGMSNITMISSPRALSRIPSQSNKGLASTLVVEDGGDTNSLYPNYASHNVRPTLRIPSGYKIVGFLGLLTEYQGVSVLLEAIPNVLKTMREVHFLIMGYPNVEHYREKAKAIGIENYVTFTGKVPYEEIPKYLAICDVGVSPKLLTTEANGKLLNYMAMGLPIVASDIPGNREILGDLGVYADVGNSISLANALAAVLSNEKHAREMGRRLREKAVAEHSWEFIGERIAKVYRGLTDVDKLPSPSENDPVEKWL